MFRDLIRMIWRRDSDSATIVCIHLAELMSSKDLREMADYFNTLAECRDRRRPR